MTDYYESAVPGVSTKGRITVKKGRKNETAAYIPGFGSAIGGYPTETGLSTVLSEMKDRYNDSLRRNFDASAERLKNERDEELREQYIREQQEKAALPEQLAKFGINGGAAETTLAELMARYQNARRDARKNYRDGLFDLEQSLSEKSADLSQKFDEKWLDYLIKKLLTAEEGGNHAGLFNL